MPGRLQLSLSEQQRAELREARDHHPKPYIREQAAAILRVADGSSLRQTSSTGILKPRRRETLKDWVDRFLAAGIPGLLVKAGRGRKPAFSPSPPIAPTGQPGAASDGQP